MKLSKIDQYAGQIFRYIPRALSRRKIIRIAGVRIDSSLPCFSPDLRKQLYLNAWEQDEIAMVSRYLDADDVVLELGSCIGFLSTFVAQRLSERGKLKVIEANPRLIPVIEYHMQLNEVSFDITHGVAGQEQSYDFYIADSIISSSLSPRDNATRETVPGIDLNRILRDFRPSMLIMDIEGGEYGLLKTLEPLDSVSKILIEFHGINQHQDDYDSIISDFRKQGFELVHRGRNDDRVHFFNITRK